ncbi:1,6-anhydro-N-acetylmuramyl-L-alanine amidase AmpD [Zwartia sp.]|uniref:1,6-anhydro-N-acetylmuramyl-L-alanine amidase AmpD n=1 Tax=Zwartia sp. TaxID=2978004 RepID=UPI002723D784|nr:1,6-anhydro-N-acetylmuramyl-L-alanine amidase AmpD [Zwartia sp.]MDO9024184.1 1,6-anhydro-N-acetylmuramyl-L-alanine amidase AmpD [Zwartia sp.]
MKLDDQGWLEQTASISLRASPNFNDRPPGTDISLLVIHNISLPPGQFGTPYVADLFLNQLDLMADPWFEKNLEGLNVSAHFLIDRTGHITQFVSCRARAWHAGVSCHEGRDQCNDFSLGIELEGTDTLAYTDAQYQSLAALTKCLREQYPLTAVRGHCHIAPVRKTDPGPAFDWPRYAALAQWPAAALPTA